MKFLWQVIPAAGQFFLNTHWKPHPSYGNPNIKKTYDPKKKACRTQTT